MASCRRSTDGTLNPDYCTAHCCPVWKCAAEFEKKASLLQEKVDKLVRLEQINNELRILGTQN